jgi:hypothetical protein
MSITEQEISELYTPDEVQSLISLTGELKHHSLNLPKLNEILENAKKIIGDRPEPFSILKMLNTAINNAIKLSLSDDLQVKQIKKSILDNIVYTLEETHSELIKIDSKKELTPEFILNYILEKSKLYQKQNDDIVV